MSDTPWTLTLSEPFETESFVLAVRVPGVADEIPLRVERGAWQGTLPGRPTSLRVAIEAQGQPSTAAASATPVEVSASVEALAGDGAPLPEADAVRVTITWAKQCHTDHTPRRNDRFGSREHMYCADLVGTVDGLRLSPATTLLVGRAALTFGEIIALAGDFYAHLDDRAAVEFADAWPTSSSFTARLVGGDYRAVTLRDDDAQHVTDLAAAIKRSSDTTTMLDELKQYVDGSHPTRRYLALASQNVCHFGHPDDARNEALRLYLRYHERALTMARAAGVADVQNAVFREALVVEAFGDHFLTDLFASGHMRVPRRALVDRLGLLVGGLVLSKKCHDEDNRLGLWCTTRAERDTPGRRVWRAYGDGFLMAPCAKVHKERVQLAVCAGLRELVLAARGRPAPPLGERAEGMIPVPLQPGEDAARGGRRTADNIPAEQMGPNHYPHSHGVERGGEAQVFLRVGPPDSTRYRDALKPWTEAVEYDTLK